MFKGNCNRKILIFTVAVFFFISNQIFAQSITNLENQNGFLNYKFGSYPSQIKDIFKFEGEYFNGNQNVTEYNYYEYGLKKGKLNIINTNLAFYKDRLFFIEIIFSIKTGFSDAVEYLEKLYGPGTKSQSENPAYFWYGEKISLAIFYDYDEDNKGKTESFGTIWVTFDKIFRPLYHPPTE